MFPCGWHVCLYQWQIRDIRIVQFTCAWAIACASRLILCTRAFMSTMRRGRRTFALKLNAHIFVFVLKPPIPGH